MKIHNKEIKIASLFMVMLVVSMVFVQVVSATADSTQNNVIDISKKNPISEEYLKLASKNTNVLKETNNEKVVSFKKNDGSIAYGIIWKDEKNPDRINFAFVDQKDLVAKNRISAESLNDNSVVVAAVTSASYSFYHGSYAATYGNSLTGGVHIYLSPRDAPWVAGGASGAAGVIGAAIAGVYTKNANIANAAGFIVAYAVATVYWSEENSDGSLDIWIPYTSLVTVLITYTLRMQIGSHWYVL